MCPFHWPSRFPSAFSKVTRAVYQDSFLPPPFQSPRSWSLEGGSVMVPSQEQQTCQFFTLWSNLIISDFTLWGDSLQDLTYLTPFTFTNMCLPHGKPYTIKPNFILDSSFPCFAWLCCHTHAHHTCYGSLPFYHHHAVASCFPILICLSWNSINRFSTNMYIQNDSI